MEECAAQYEGINVNTAVELHQKAARFLKKDNARASAHLEKSALLLTPRSKEYVPTVVKAAEKVYLTQAGDPEAVERVKELLNRHAENCEKAGLFDKAREVYRTILEIPEYKRDPRRRAEAMERIARASDELGEDPVAVLVEAARALPLEDGLEFLGGNIQHFEGLHKLDHAFKLRMECVALLEDVDVARSIAHREAAAGYVRKTKPDEYVRLIGEGARKLLERAGRRQAIELLEKHMFLLTQAKAHSYAARLYSLMKEVGGAAVEEAAPEVVLEGPPGGAEVDVTEGAASDRAGEEPELPPVGAQPPAAPPGAPPEAAPSEEDAASGGGGASAPASENPYGELVEDEDQGGREGA